MPLMLAMALAVTLAAAELPTDEKAKIEKLIEHVRVLKDAKFVRNGVEYDAATAAKFIKGKWDANAADIDSAREFIDKAATQSSTTGKPYLIRIKQGDQVKEVKSGEYLLEQLKALEKQ